MQRIIMSLAIFGFFTTMLAQKNYASFADYPVPDAPYEEMSIADNCVTFQLWAPTAQAVVVRLYDAPIEGTPLRKLSLSKGNGGMWKITYKKALGNARYYTFQVKVNGIWLDETPGISAKMVGTCGRRGVIATPSNFAPRGWESDTYVNTRPQDAILYEMHHRDFSIDASSGVTPELRGKFLALAERAAYLKELGITHVHILPSYDYSSVDEAHPEQAQYNWGYDPLNYNVPEGSYSTDAGTPWCRVIEFKQMVQALHQQGIGLVLDVVYNHVVDAGTSNFNRTVPGYFFRQRPDGSLANASGCGNETASERTMMRRYMVESIKYWMKEYHVDGFRFDLMGIHDIETMREIREAAETINPNVIIYGEGWAAEAPQLPNEQLAMKANMKSLPGIAAFCDDMRDGLRGPFSDDHEAGMLGGKAGLEESVKFGIAGGIDHPQVDITKVNYSQATWCNAPQQLLAYVSCHDDMCLTDRLRSSIPEVAKALTGKDKTADAHLVQLDLLAQTAVFTSQGIPFMQAGEEVLRDKKLVHNSYCSPDSINAIDWTNRDRYPLVWPYYHGLMTLRKAHPAFHMGNAECVRKHLSFFGEDDFCTESGKKDCIVAYHLHDLKGAGDTWQDIIVVLNARDEEIHINIPEGEYKVIARSGIINVDGFDTLSTTHAHVAAHSALIIAR